jgi:hypothetical protein
MSGRAEGAGRAEGQATLTGAEDMVSVGAFTVGGLRGLSGVSVRPGPACGGGRSLSFSSGER